MKKIKSTYILGICAFAAIQSCGVFSTKNKGEKTQQNDISLSGEWRNKCTQRSWIFGSVFDQQTRKFGPLGDFERDTTVYTDPQCAAADIMFHEQGTYSALSASVDVPGANDINFTITGASVTPKSDNSALKLNEQSYCGIQTWEKDKATDVIGLECLGVVHANGEVVFDIYKLDQASKTLELGRASLFLDKGDAQSRPKVLDSANRFQHP